MNHSLAYRIDCKYCPGNYPIYWDKITKKFYDDPNFTIIHKKYDLSNESNEELKEIKKILKRILVKIRCIDEDIKKIKEDLGLNHVKE